jgi:hypothetical protein
MIRLWDTETSTDWAGSSLSLFGWVRLTRDRKQHDFTFGLFISLVYIINIFTCSYLVALIKKVLYAYQVVEQSEFRIINLH